MKIFGEKKTYEVINIYLEIQRKKSHINFGVYQELFFSPFSFESRFSLPNNIFLILCFLLEVWTP